MNDFKDNTSIWEIDLFVYEYTNKHMPGKLGLSSRE